jgi:predicted RND superfamily exporter protein
MWTRVARFILRNRILLIVLITLFTGFMAYMGRNVKMSYEYARLLPEDDENYINHQKFKKLFGEEANIFVVGFQDSSFFEVKKFNDLLQLTRDVKKISGVKEAVSVAQLVYFAKNTKEKKFDVKPIFPDTITSQKQLDSLIDVVDHYPLYKNVFFNDTSKVFLVAISVTKEVLNDKSRIDLINSVKNYVDEFGKAHNLNIKYSGLPYIRTEITRKIKSELNIFLILAAFVSILMLYIFFRSFKAVLFSMIVVAVAVSWVMGTMGILHYKVTILTGMIPPLLIVIGIPNSIFLLNKYFAEFKRHGNKIKALQRVIQKTGSAIFLTNLTTASGFATFIITNSDILKEFGIVATINIMALFILSLIIIPISYSFLKPPKEKHTKHLDGKFVNIIVQFLIESAQTRRKQVYTLTFIFILIGIYGATKIKSTGYMVDDLPKDDPVYTDLKFFEHHFKGLMPLEIIVDTKKKKGAYKLSTLKRVDKLQKKLNEIPELSKSVSIADGMKMIKQSYYNGKEKYYKLPKGSEKTFIFNYLKNTKGNNNTNFLKSFVDDSTKSILRVSTKVEDIGTKNMKVLFNNLRIELDSIFDKNKYETIITGTSVVFFKGTSYLVNNLYISLSLAVILISMFMAMMFASWRMVIISLFPNLLPLLLTAGLMGYFGIPIKPSTILVFSIAFGISVDDTIHYLAKYRQELISTNWDIKKSVINALNETGTSMIYTSIILFFGFGVFATSSFGGTVALGVLVSFTLLIAMLANLVLLPALLLSFERLITTKAFKEPLLHIFDEEEDIELDDLKIEKTVRHNE